MMDSPLLTDLARTALGVVLAVLPIAAMFAIFQLWLLKLPRTEVTRIVAGTVLVCGWFRDFGASTPVGAI